MSRIRTILHPTDLSENSAPAFHLACALAHDYGADLVLLHVYPSPVNGAEAVDRHRPGNLEDDLMEKIRELVPEDRTLTVDYRVEEGSPAEVILGAARECGLVVMGTHGRTGLRRALMGSVAEKVLREARCPVVTVRPAARVPAEAIKSRSGTEVQSAELGGGD